MPVLNIRRPGSFYICHLAASCKKSAYLLEREALLEDEQSPGMLCQEDKGLREEYQDTRQMSKEAIVECSSKIQPSFPSL